MVASLASLFSRAWSSATSRSSGTPGGLRRTSGRRPELLCQLEPRRIMSVVPDNHTILKFDTTYGNVYIELFDDVAPISVANFLSYTNSDKLNETFFHRMTKVANGDGIDILQGGGFYFDGNGAPSSVATGSPIVLENSGKSNVAGTIAMARTSSPNTATSQFFINVNNNTNLDIGTDPGGGYAVFGQIVKGMDIIQAIFGLRTFDLDPDPANTPPQNQHHTYDNVPVTAHYTTTASSLTTADLVYLRDASVVSRADYRAVAGSSINGATNAQDQLIITSLGLDGRSEIFTPDSADYWKYKNLQAATGAPDVTGNLVAFYDPKTGLKHAVGPSANGLILFTSGANNTWTFSNLTTSVSGGQIIQGEITAFTTTDGFVYIAGMSDSGDLVAFRQTGTASNWTWQFHNFSDVDLAQRGLTTPAFTGRLTSYVTSWNGLNIVGLDGNGDIQAVWWAPGIDQNLWTQTNLSDVTGAPAFTGGLTVYLTSWNATNIVGITQEGHVSVTWWLPEFQGNWRTDDLTAQFNGALLVGNTISSFVTPWGATNIGGLDSNGKLWVYWWAPGIGGNAWVVTDMSTAVPAGTKAMVGRITGITSTASTINLVGTASNGDVMRYYWNPAGDQLWKADDVSYLASISS